MRVHWLLLIILLASCSGKYGHLTTKRQHHPVKDQIQTIAVLGQMDDLKLEKLSTEFDPKLKSTIHWPQELKKQKHLPLLFQGQEEELELQEVPEHRLQSKTSEPQPQDRQGADDNEFLWILMWSVVIIGTAYVWWVLGGGCIPWIFMGIAFISMLVLMLAH